MTHLTRRSLILIAALTGIAESAYGQICVTSDPNFDTACGTHAFAIGSVGGSNDSAFGAYALYSNTTGLNNTAAGAYALTNSDGSNNTASGEAALYSNTTGSENTASGHLALYSNTLGDDNTASGVAALYSNTTGSFNTASGVEALNRNTTGEFNTASGGQALYYNTTGSYNTASGQYALLSNTTGTFNTASGFEALYSNRTGSENTAAGSGAIYYNINGHYNTAAGFGALYYNRYGRSNTAAGYWALKNTSGNTNIAVGYQAGLNLTTGDNNIDIGSQGVAAESGVIRIGTITDTTSSQNATYIAGIYNTSVAGGLEVVVNSNGQLGTVSSSERFKTDIESMDVNTAKLQQLRPVTFHYKTDSQGVLRYGLIAEEVAKVYPELVVRDKHGRIDGVRYDELAPMLLNEVQKQEKKIDAQEKVNANRPPRSVT